MPTVEFDRAAIRRATGLSPVQLRLIDRLASLKSATTGKIKMTDFMRAVLQDPFVSTEETSEALRKLHARKLITLNFPDTENFMVHAGLVIEELALERENR